RGSNRRGSKKGGKVVVKGSKKGGAVVVKGSKKGGAVVVIPPTTTVKSCNENVDYGPCTKCVGGAFVFVTNPGIACHTCKSGRLTPDDLLPCDDRNANTTNDRCESGKCVGQSVSSPTVPQNQGQTQI
ncbi:MAG: hypothetical protein D3922_08585, partial [Candidatus Electrothrix sp. AR1]|nr:hypothetical protein [Candidatus Electrothrix sp. AR1]